MRGRLLGGRYRLGPVIGTGGTGSVHRARDEETGRDVAVKLLQPGAAASDCERLRREAEYLGALRHPNLVAVLDAGADGGGTDGRGRPVSAWFAMELVAGPDLRTLLHERGPMDGAAVRRVLTGVLGALGAMHDAGLVHRDVTPSNILLTADPFARWEAKLTDLGIAHRMLAAPLTDVGRVVGTAAYLSPEQVTGGPVGPEADVYALALVAVEALTGSTPFPGSAAESATRRLVRSPALPDDLAPAWRALLAAATAVHPEDRPSVDAMRLAAAELPDDAGVRPGAATRMPGLRATTAAVAATAVLQAAATAVHPVAAAPEVTPERRRRGRTGVLVGAAALLLVAVATTGALAVAAVQSAGGSGTPLEAAAATPATTPSSSAAPAQGDVDAGGMPLADPAPTGEPAAPDAAGPADDSTGLGPRFGPGAQAGTTAPGGTEAQSGQQAEPDPQRGPGGQAAAGSHPGPGAPGDAEAGAGAGPAAP